MTMIKRSIRVISELILYGMTAGPVVWFVVVDGVQYHTAADGLRSLGRLAGITGLAWLLLAMFLSIRLPGLDRPLGGLIRIWHIHHWLGAASFLLLLLHPLLLALAATPAGPAAILSTLAPPFAHWPLWAGWLALLLMMAFLAPTFSFFGEPDYQRWKALHLLSGLAGLSGLVHAIALTRTLTEAQAFWLWGGLGVLAAAAITWRKVLSPVFARRPYQITRVAARARGVVEISLASKGKKLDHLPGQFVYVTPQDPGLRAGRCEEHPYTISSAPHEEELRIAVKNLGDASGALLDVAVGSTALVEGPYGQFLPAASQAPTLWIGGGIGLTPFVSAARALAERSRQVNTQLVYCANDRSRAYFLDELNTISERVPGFTVHTHYFAKEGALTKSYLQAQVPDFTNRQVFICGPLPLINLSRQLLLAAGLPRSRITSEEFTLL